MNPWLIIGAGIFWVLSVGGAYVKGQTTGANRVIAQQASNDEVRRETLKTAEQGAANAISKIKIVNTTIRQKAETVVRDNVRYVDCRHAAGMLDTLNEAITGRPKPVGDGKLPATQPAK